MKGFVVRLIPPRPSFPLDMTEPERATMAEHLAYWDERCRQGAALAFGPVADPEGPYGLAVFLAEGPDDAQRVCDDDPAIRSPHGFRAELRAFVQVITPDGTH